MALSPCGLFELIRISITTGLLWSFPMVVKEEMAGQAEGPVGNGEESALKQGSSCGGPLHEQRGAGEAEPGSARLTVKEDDKITPPNEARGEAVGETSGHSKWNSSIDAPPVRQTVAVRFMQGRRGVQEDRHVVVPDLRTLVDSDAKQEIESWEATPGSLFFNCFPLFSLSYTLISATPMSNVSILASLIPLVSVVFLQRLSLLYLTVTEELPALTSALQHFRLSWRTCCVGNCQSKSQQSRQSRPLSMGRLSLQKNSKRARGPLKMLTPNHLASSPFLHPPLRALHLRRRPLMPVVAKRSRPSFPHCLEASSV